MPIKQYLETYTAKFLYQKRKDFLNHLKELEKKKANETQRKEIIKLRKRGNNKD